MDALAQVLDAEEHRGSSIPRLRSSRRSHFVSRRGRGFGCSSFNCGSLGTSRDRTSSHATSCWPWDYGNVLAVFITGESDTRTVVEIVERHFSGAQVVGCRAQMPVYIERLNAKVSAARTRGSGPNVTGGQR